MADKKKKEKIPKLKVIFEDKRTCPHCDKRIVVKKTKRLITAAVPAEYDERIVIEKDAQKTLKESTNPHFDKKRKKKNK